MRKNSDCTEHNFIPVLIWVLQYCRPENVQQFFSTFHQKDLLAINCGRMRRINLLLIFKHDLLPEWIYHSFKFKTRNWVCGTWSKANSLRLVLEDRYMMHLFVSEGQNWHFNLKNSALDPLYIVPIRFIASGAHSKPGILGNTYSHSPVQERASLWYGHNLSQSLGNISFQTEVGDSHLPITSWLCNCLFMFFAGKWNLQYTLLQKNWLNYQYRTRTTKSLPPSRTQSILVPS